MLGTVPTEDNHSKTGSQEIPPFVDNNNEGIQSERYMGDTRKSKEERGTNNNPTLSQSMDGSVRTSVCSSGSSIRLASAITILHNQLTYRPFVTSARCPLNLFARRCRYRKPTGVLPGYFLVHELLHGDNFNALLKPICLDGEKVTESYVFATLPFIGLMA